MSTSEKTKQQIVSKLKRGAKVKELMKIYKVSKSSIYAWKSELEPQPFELNQPLFHKNWKQ